MHSSLSSGVTLAYSFPAELRSLTSHVHSSLSHQSSVDIYKSVLELCICFAHTAFVSRLLSAAMVVGTSAIFTAVRARLGSARVALGRVPDPVIRKTLSEVQRRIVVDLLEGGSQTSCIGAEDVATLMEMAVDVPWGEPGDLEMILASLNKRLMR